MLAQTFPRDIARQYDRLAPRYDRLHHRWLRYAGGEAQAALEGLVRALATPESALLDVGCGTGQLARTLIAEGRPPKSMTLLDPSQAMLARCADIPSMKVEGRLEALPFADATFDVVTCVWALETVPDPALALSELCRVVRPGGVVCVTFCADFPTLSLAERVMRQALLYRGTGRFLPCARVMDLIERFDGFEACKVPCRGPAATVLARRKSTPVTPFM